MADRLATDQTLDSISEEIKSLEEEKEAFEDFRKRVSRSDHLEDLEDYYSQKIIRRVEGVPEETVAKLVDETPFSEELAHMYYVLSYDGALDCGALRYLALNSKTAIQEPVKNELVNRINRYVSDLSNPVKFLKNEEEKLVDYRNNLNHLDHVIEDTKRKQSNLSGLVEKDAIDHYKKTFKPVEQELEMLIEERQSELQSYPENQRKMFEDLHYDAQTDYPVLYDTSQIIQEFYKVESDYDITHIV